MPEIFNPEYYLRDLVIVFKKETPHNKIIELLERMHNYSKERIDTDFIAIIGLTDDNITAHIQETQWTPIDWESISKSDIVETLTDDRNIDDYL